MSKEKLPYLPLFVKDLLSDEKLRSVSSSAGGTYFYLLCLLHLSDPYGTYLLPVKEASSSYFKTWKRFEIIPQGFPLDSPGVPPGNEKFPRAIKRLGTLAYNLRLNIPYSYKIIFASLVELISADVLQISEDYIIQKRMVKDELKRSRYKSNGTAGSVSWNKRLKELNIIKTAESKNKLVLKKGVTGETTFSEFSAEVKRQLPGTTKAQTYGFIMSFASQDEKGRFRFQKPGFDIREAWNQHKIKTKSKLKPA